MPASVSMTIMITVVLLVLILATLWLLGLLDVIQKDQFYDLALKSGGGVLLLGTSGVVIAWLRGSKETPES